MSASIPSNAGGGGVGEAEPRRWQVVLAPVDVHRDAVGDALPAEIEFVTAALLVHGLWYDIDHQVQVERDVYISEPRGTAAVVYYQWPAAQVDRLREEIKGGSVPEIKRVLQDIAGGLVEGSKGRVYAKFWQTILGPTASLQGEVGVSRAEAMDCRLCHEDMEVEWDGFTTVDGNWSFAQVVAHNLMERLQLDARYSLSDFLPFSHSGDAVDAAPAWTAAQAEEVEARECVVKEARKAYMDRLFEGEKGQVGVDNMEGRVVDGVFTFSGLEEGRVRDDKEEGEVVDGVFSGLELGSSSGW